MSESEKPFTVKDRRHFTPDGEVREESESPAEPAKSADTVPEPVSGGAPAPEATAPAEPPREEPAAPRTEPAGEAKAEAEPSPRPGPSEDASADFTPFIFSFGAQAGMLLAGQGLPEGMSADDALGQARWYISVLEVLEKKTEGNRTPEETEILEKLLFELRMSYVEKTRGGGS